MDRALPNTTELDGGEPLRRRPVVTNGALGMGLVIFTEIMLFAGFISAYVIVESAAPIGAWPPADQPRLPIARTAINTLALLASGVALYLAGRHFRAGRRELAAGGMTLALVLGGFFVLAQGWEWIALLKQGLTLQSSQLGSFFYTIVGTHALHALAAILGLTWGWYRVQRGTMTPSAFSAVQMFWWFVVLVWPVLYAVVYL